MPPWLLPSLLFPPAAFVLIELGARLWLRVRDKYSVLQPHLRMEMEVDKQALPDLTPLVHTSVNADGERGDEVPADPESVLRVLVAGGSAAECYLLDQPASWPMVAQAELSKLGPRTAHVGNVSRSLVACEVLQRMLAKTLRQVRSLDVIVLMVGASDVVAWLEQKTPPQLEAGRIPLSKICQEHPEGPFGWKLKQLALYRLLRRANARLRKPLARKTGAGKSLIKHREMRAAASTWITEVPNPEPMLVFFEEHFEALIRTCQQHAKHVLVVRQPWFEKDFTPEENARLWNFGQGRPYVEELDTYYTHHVVCELMRATDAIASRIATKTGALQLDLMPVLPRNFDTYYDFLHFTPAGAQLVGKAVAQAIHDGLGSAPEPSPHR